MLRTFHLVESAEPAPLVAMALNAALFKRCRIERPAPVHFVPMPRWGGWCQPEEDTRDGEVQLSDQLLDDQKTESGMLDSLLQVYLHEIAHRLMPGHNHDPAFLSMNALLLIRAGEDQHGRPYLNNLSLYDAQDFDLVRFCSIGEALDWSLAHARELAESELTAEACAGEIMQRFEGWREWKAGTERREATRVVAVRSLKNRVAELSQSRWKWLTGGIVIGTLIHFIPMFF